MYVDDPYCSIISPAFTTEELTASAGESAVPTMTGVPAGMPVAAAAAFLCSAGSASITGSDLVLDGGWSAR